MTGSARRYNYSQEKESTGDGVKGIRLKEDARLSKVGVLKYCAQQMALLEEGGASRAW